MSVVFMSLALGAVSYGIGILPLSVVFSKSHISYLATLGNGLLLGAALGIIIPEGIETLIEAHPGGETPVTKIALALLVGFAFILLVEHASGAGSHAHDADAFVLDARRTPPNESVEFDADLDAVERNDATRGEAGERVDATARDKTGSSDGVQPAFALTLGLCMHALTDGLALGVSALSDRHTDYDSELPFVIFLALVIHKAPTTLAFTASLLALSLSPEACKKYIAIFSISTPLSALASYGVFSFMGIKPEWTGVAILISGGSFLYVAQSISHHTQAATEESRIRPLLIVMGMFIPVAVASAFGHGH